MEEIPVKVAVRVRPLLSKEILHNHQVCVRLVPNAKQVIIGKDHVFTFDFVFGKNSTQEEVYAVCIKPLLVSLTEGYNATVFAYGQTGSGKTYTIGGDHIASVSVDERGIIPRAIQELFQHISEHHNINFHVKVSYIEVYKEELRDLLDLETSVKELHIREDEKGNTVIVGAKEFQVECADEVISLLESGNAARHRGTTQMNEHSSRSHAIFTISICQKQSTEYQNNTDAAQDSIASKFHFVDLAGSERVAKTGNTGERFKESVQINSGLLALGNVISALGDPKRKSVHIPYRDAKITRILKDSLGGNAKTVMITCISPSSLDFDESLNSLKYANRAKNIRNKPVVNYNPEKDRIDEMELEIRLLREALQNQQVSNQHLYDLNEEKARIGSLEEQLTRLQVQYFSYRNCVDEAFPFLVDLNNDVSLRRSQRDRLQSWITMVQNVRKEALTIQETDAGTETSPDPHHITILQLKRELKKCQQVLVMDEELFSQKNHEVQILQNQIKTLLQEKEEQQEFLNEAQETQRLQTEKMVEQQMLIDQLKLKLEKFTDVKALDSQSAYEDGPAVVAFARRPYSVPLTKNLLRPLHLPSGTKIQKGYTSPPVLSLAQIMAEFHVRRQMILSKIEDQDKVLHCHLSDQSDEDNTGNEDKTSYKYSINQTWTQSHTSLCFLPDVTDMKCQVVKSGLFNESALQTDTTTGEEIDSLQKIHAFNMEKLKNSELRLAEAEQKIRELALNIKRKEELIKELVRTGKDAQSVSRQYSLKITKLEQEIEQAKRELAETQKQLQELDSKELRDIPEKVMLQKECQKKMEAAKLKVQTLQKKQQDTKSLASLSNQSEREARELEQKVAQMKHQQSQIQKRLCEESEKKKQLEAELQQDQQQIKELQLKMEQQQKILKLKDKEIAAFKKKNNNSVGAPQKLQKLEEQKKWLDEEMERILQQHQQLAELEEDLKKREAIVAKKEVLLQEKSQLEIKKMRSSQALNKDSMKLSTRLSMLDQELCNKSMQLQGSTTEDKSDILEKIQILQMERDQLLRRRNSMDEKLKDGKVLSTEEEHVLFQLEEGIEALVAAIDYKNESIHNRQHLLRSSSQSLSQSKHNVIGKLVSLSAAELRAIIISYFNKIVGLRESERKLQVQIEEQEMKSIHQKNTMRELESALEHIKLQCDRQLTHQRQEHEKKVQFLLNHFKEQNSEGIAETLKGYEVKIQQLEKDLFFYKKTSRELKKKLKGRLGESSE
ncbi:kinesin-like protein KIF27 isoform X1 [Corvus cornix cornix]|uniref:kinesin-like protein KIF27 isoform X1 n=1 Tax=Corvus cornix cornix TaxID=932674 RepID=UPI00194EE576|nr:kinesin-like protein KIF27 isoform X1 [Corvus cornix cornix]XP_019143973.3 kinesin-like protein KIF27 isoform X1 [Corvus cornix cornix]XP_019143974.3 kinesin-like protein KIF27 isoform X1 [Corvus cornix cornix]XP_039422915.1 kinesin-like protein KIF27 isoform X1 [Corvus cornix cornix]XP_039422916.1 kinesin-like protein KIF27 isoform X1 [Corvus cornix cornix]XP_039422917.1 kinesin-like protein KIF27 isoform X1 [Corvus cornix cornix]XP_039422918.1 kinesin-like protein KIF27 isoform X1 [Corvu